MLADMRTSIYEKRPAQAGRFFLNVAPLGYRVAALYKPDDDHDDRYHKQYMDKASYRVGRDEAQEPQNDQYGCDGYKHI
jgi:hypothetical protein